MHRLNIFLSCFGHSGWAGFFFGLFFALTLTLEDYKIAIYPLLMGITALFRNNDISRGSRAFEHIDIYYDDYNWTTTTTSISTMKRWVGINIFERMTSLVRIQYKMVLPMSEVTTRF